ncbi:MULTISPECIES: sigma-70 family RNA polymerase sigma factor [unclassified Variovorax]|uniref:sigma-70 family RNA polymerase sigma factor n=1 Tax=unclassified Variovorax TaxID=663243 RepID=UPI0008B044A1|nr:MULTISPECIES: sigma-70 family RNA polymerase sigma factor [unclassified Variovorax]SEK01640.1 RNA polymerase sigma-70 factor, ECF subfamily [Variovorax sp. OK202]SFD31906.1 RNA polymerase sigma-70 factor, ECF subfamily [Variovorax sp. OK212]
MPASHSAHDPLHPAQQFFSGHHAWLTGRLQARLGNMADAQDLASETFVRVLGQRDLEAVKEPRAFLTTIAKRLLFTLWRRRELERAYLDTLALRPDELAPSPEERAVLLETLEHIASALEGLPLKARQAFLLSQLDGLGYHAIAAELGISHSTVRRHMADAFGRIALAMARQQAGIGGPLQGAPHALLASPVQAAQP